MPEALSRREDAIVTLLRRYRDLEGTSSSGEGGGDRNDARALFTPGGEWDQSGCDDLDACLSLLKADRPIQWWHLTERYVRCTVRSRRVKTTKGRIGKLAPHSEALGFGVRPMDGQKLAGGEVLVMVEEWRPQVRMEKVRRGRAFLVAQYPWERYRWRDLVNAA